MKELSRKINRAFAEMDQIIRIPELNCSQGIFVGEVEKLRKIALTGSKESNESDLTGETADAMDAREDKEEDGAGTDDSDISKLFGSSSEDSVFKEGTARAVVDQMFPSRSVVGFLGNVTNKVSDIPQTKRVKPEQISGGLKQRLMAAISHTQVTCDMSISDVQEMQDALQGAHATAKLMPGA